MSTESSHDYLPHQDVCIRRAYKKWETYLHVSTIYSDRITITVAIMNQELSKSKIRKTKGTKVQKWNEKKADPVKCRKNTHTHTRIKLVFTILKWTSNRRRGGKWLDVFVLVSLFILLVDSFTGSCLSSLSLSHSLWLCCHRHCRCRQLLLVVRCSSHPLTMLIVVVARINYFIVIFFALSFTLYISSLSHRCAQVCVCPCMCVIVLY